jgi:hypothetical protein
MTGRIWFNTEAEMPRRAFEYVVVAELVPQWEVVRGWLDEPATATQLEQATWSGAQRKLAWEALLGLEALERGRPALTWGGSWLWDFKSANRCASDA